MRAHLAWRAAVVAVVLVAGACGDGDGGSGDGDGLRKLPLAAAGAGRSSATLSSEVADDTAASMIAPAQPVEYRATADAASVPESATAYEVKPRSADEVRATVAEALDVDPVRIEVGPGGYDWYYSGVSPDTAVSSSAIEPACAPDERCAEPTPAPTVPGVPSAADAERRAREILEGIGGSLDGRFEVFGEDGYNRTVKFTPEVDGVSVAGLESQIAFGAEGRVEYANGFLAEVEAIGEYPLVGLAEAVERLEKGFGAGGDVRTMGAPEPAIDPAASGAGSGDGQAGSGGSAGAEPDAPTTDGGTAGGSAGSGGSAGAEPATDTPCAEGQPCSSPPSPPTDEPTMTIEPDPSTPTVPLEPLVIEITGAELSLQLVAAGCPGDPVYLVPTFVLQPDDAATVIAVEEDAIAGASGDADEAERCPEIPTSDVPVGKPEPAPLPADAGREPATP